MKKYTIEIITALIGAIGGYIYWMYWGCENGCPIKSVWWKMTIYGVIMGWLLGGLIKEYLIKSKK